MPFQIRLVNKSDLPSQPNFPTYQQGFSLVAGDFFASFRSWCHIRMLKNTSHPSGTRSDFSNLFIVVLSVYVLVALVIDTFFKLDPELSKLLAPLDDFICVIFLIDFCICFYKAESKLEFMKWGWIDLLSSIPTLSYRPGTSCRSSPSEDHFCWLILQTFCSSRSKKFSPTRES